MMLREQLRPYTRELMKEAHEKGTPVMRTLFYEYPKDPVCWEIEDEYLYGPDILAAPVCRAGQQKKRVYLPRDEVWIEYETKKEYAGKCWAEVETPIDQMPVFIKKGADVQLLHSIPAMGQLHS